MQRRAWAFSRRLCITAPSFIWSYLRFFAHEILETYSRWFFCLALHERAMALEDTVVTEPRYFAMEDSLENQKAYIDKLKKHRAITNAKDAIICTSLKALIR